MLLGEGNKWNSLIKINDNKSLEIINKVSREEAEENSMHKRETEIWPDISFIYSSAKGDKKEPGISDNILWRCEI